MKKLKPLLIAITLVLAFCLVSYPQAQAAVLVFGGYGAATTYSACPWQPAATSPDNNCTPTGTTNYVFWPSQITCPTATSPSTGCGANTGCNSGNCNALYCTSLTCNGNTCKITCPNPAKCNPTNNCNGASGSICLPSNSCTNTPQGNPKPDDNYTMPSAPVQAQDMVKMVNQERARYGLASLSLDTTLSQVAQLKAEDLVKYNYFDHVSPRLGNVGNMLSKAGILYRAFGENLAHAGNLGRAHDGLMASPGHRANILGNFNKIGIGFVQERNMVMVVQIFIRA